MIRKEIPVVAIAIILLCGLWAFAEIDAADEVTEAADRPALAARPHRPLRFICITTCINEPFFVPVEQGAKDAAALMDVECEFIGTQAVDVPAQVQMVRNAIADGYDGIAINVIDPKAFDGVIAQARQQEIPVIAFNINAQPNSRLPTVAQNLYDAGRKAAFVAAPLIAEGSHVLMNVHGGAPTAMDARYHGIRDGLTDKDVIWETVVTGDGIPELEQAFAEHLRANPQTKVVFATGLPATEAAGRAIEKNFRNKGYVIVGFDTSAEILRMVKTGTIAFTVDQQAYAQGFYPVMQLAMLKLHGIEPSNMDAGAKIVRAKDATLLLGKGKQARRDQQ